MLRHTKLTTMKTYNTRKDNTIQVLMTIAFISLILGATLTSCSSTQAYTPQKPNKTVLKKCTHLGCYAKK